MVRAGGHKHCPDGTAWGHPAPAPRTAGRADQALPSAAELVAKAEAQRTLVDAVLHLDEPYRSTVLLRFFEELSAAEIARRQDVPAGTVRWRLAEALQRLRSELDAKFGGDPRAWCTVLLPLVGRGTGTAVAVGSSSLASLGLILMSLKLIAVLGLAGLLWFLVDQTGLLSGSEAGPGLEDPRPEIVAFRPLAEPELQADVDPGATRAPLDPRPTSPARVPAAGTYEEVLVRARLLGSDGVPVADGRLEPDQWMSLPQAPNAVTPSDVTGRVELRWRVAANVFTGSRGFSAEFVVHRNGCANERRVALVHRERVLDLGDIVLRPGGAISGRVVDERGTPLEGVAVSAAAPERKRLLDGGVVSSDRGRSGGDRTRSGTDGSFALRGLAPGFVRVEAVLGDRRGRSGRVEVRAGMESYDLVMVVLKQRPPDSVITGLVLDPTGQPVPRADLRYSYRGILRSGSGSVTVNRAGQFRIEEVQNLDYSLLASDPRGRFGEAERGGVRPGDFVVLRLPLGRRLELELRDDTGRAIPVATIGTRAAGRSTNPLQYLPRARSETGAYVLRLPAVAFQLLVKAPGCEEKTLGPYDPADLPGQQPTISVQLARAPMLAGRVSIAAAPASGVEVRLHRREQQRTRQDGFPVWLEARPVIRCRTGADGRFVLTVREPGPFFVRAHREGFAVTEVGPFTADDARDGRDLEIALGAGGSIRGRVRSATGRNPAGTVVGISRGDGAARTQRVGADGAFVFHHLTPGRWMVERREAEILPGNTSSTSSTGAPFREVPTVCEVFADKVTVYDVWIDLPGDTAPKGELRGRLVLGEADLAGWQVQLVPAVEDGGDVRIATAQLDRHGRFDLRLQGLGEHRLILADDTVKGPFGRRVVAPLRLVTGTNSWELRLPTAALSGTGAPRDAAGPRALGLLWEGQGAHQGVTYLHAVIGDARGRFHLPAVPAGRCRLVRVRGAALGTTSSGRQGWVTVRELELKPGENATVDLGKR